MLKRKEKKRKTWKEKVITRIEKTKEKTTTKKKC